MTTEDVEKVLKDLVRPVIEADGGDIELVEVSGNRVVVYLGSACAGCPGRPYTRAGLIEPALCAALGETVRVELSRRPPPH
ncbi:MAG: NifU family protein [Deltaproteobacteria bacterium]|nr:MAG: NifU family protein [Deltaproteobacteria bacterium]